MRFMPTRTHGILDYVVGLILILLPLVAGLPMDSAAAIIPILLGASAIIYSLLTDYELSVYRMIPMPIHLGLDAASGLLLAASPWLFGFSDRIWVPHVVIGLFEISAALTTRTTPETTRTSVNSMTPRM